MEIENRLVIARVKERLESGGKSVRQKCPWKNACTKGNILCKASTLASTLSHSVTRCPRREKLNKGCMGSLFSFSQIKVINDDLKIKGLILS